MFMSRVNNQMQKRTDSGERGGRGWGLVLVGMSHP